MKGGDAMKGELKIVIQIKGNAGSIGVKSTDSDPVFVTLDGGLGALIPRLLEIVAGAQEKWESAPLYPKCVTALPSQAQLTTPRTATGSPARPAPRPQPPMF